MESTGKRVRYAFVILAVAAMLVPIGCQGAGNGPDGSQRIEKLDYECKSQPVNKYMYYYVGREPDDPKAEAAAKALGCEHKGSIGIPKDPTNTTYRNCFCCAKP